MPPLPPGASAGSGPDESVFDGQYRIKLDAFEGPLDLLLHLIQQHELDILDIPVSFITAKYLEYLKLMQVLSIEIASEYLVMAATLVHIKSKMLLPVAPTGQDDGMPQEEEEDPRAELVRRLLEYQKYKAAAAQLAERGTLGRDVFPRGVEEEAAPGPATFAKVEVFGLLEAFEKVLKRSKIKIDHEVVFDRISITDRIVELTEKLEGRRAVRFEWLFLSASRAPSASGAITRFDLVITFLAMLEMCRMRLLRVYQTAPLQPIYMGLVESDLSELTEEERAEADRDADAKLAEEPVAQGEPAAAGMGEAAVVEEAAAASEQPAAEEHEAVAAEEVAASEQPAAEGHEAVAAEEAAVGEPAALEDEAFGEVGVVIEVAAAVEEAVVAESLEGDATGPVEGAAGSALHEAPSADQAGDESGAALPPSEDQVSELPNQDGVDDVGLETIADPGDETVTELPLGELEGDAESEPDRETMPMPPPLDAESERATIPVEPPAEHAPPMAVHIPPNPAWMPPADLLPAEADEAPTPPDGVTDDG